MMDVAHLSDLSEDWTDRIFVFWFGTAMSDRRTECFESLVNTECRIHLVTEDALAEFVVPERPLHPAFKYLSPVHRSDYLRAYFMHNYGGGYSDVKMTHSSWRPAFAAVKDSQVFGAGYPEVEGGVGNFFNSRVGGRCYYLEYRVPRLIARKLYKHHSRYYRRLVGNGAFIYKPGTEFTKRWLKIVEQRLDLLQQRLVENPAKFAREVPNQDFGEGPSLYPVCWSFLLGDILGPLVMKHHRKVLQILPAPSFENYQ